MAEVADSASATACFDSACGDGNLLTAVQKVVGGIACFGLDQDSAAIKRLRRSNPEWVLSRGDALQQRTWSRTRAGRLGGSCELAVINPPFSMGRWKGVEVKSASYTGRCSVAMAHILATLFRVCPETCVAIVPESLLHSELDANARSSLEFFYSMSIHGGLRSTTFAGARANAVIVRFGRQQRRATVAANSPGELPTVRANPRLVRGGLPVHEAELLAGGRPFVHSTDLLALARGESLDGLDLVRPIKRGGVIGDVVLLPRIGVPRREQLQAVRFARRVQLSDCVLALSFSSKAHAERWARRVRTEWRTLCRLYRGTGARYVTMRRLLTWVDALEKRV